mmetsp:Transcript_37668/g.112824  ORF Transcript_37668/g.112824 Transcript_37668/m.112824 type:complete len:210 (+) Transcript_37668:332-961(+)
MALVADDTATLSMGDNPRLKNRRNFRSADVSFSERWAKRSWICASVPLRLGQMFNLFASPSSDVMSSVPVARLRRLIPDVIASVVRSSLSITPNTSGLSTDIPAMKGTGERTKSSIANGRLGMMVPIQVNGLSSSNNARHTDVTSSTESPTTKRDLSRRSSLRARTRESGPMVRRSFAKPHSFPTCGSGRGSLMGSAFRMGRFTSTNLR